MSVCHTGVRGIRDERTLEQRLFHNDNPIVLELGCGKGEYTVGLAERIPGKNFIGIDVKGARMWTGAKRALAAGMTNVGFCAQT